MSDHIYKKVELVGSSPDGIEAAIQNALSRAGKTIRNMRWFEVTETRGQIDEGRIQHWQVTLKIGFTLVSLASPPVGAPALALLTRLRRCPATPCIICSRR